MSSSIIEILRCSNQELETLEKCLALTLHYKDDHPREAVISDRIVKLLMERIQAKSKEILELYADYDGRKKFENEVFSGHRFVSEDQKLRKHYESGIQVGFYGLVIMFL